MSDPLKSTLPILVTGATGAQGGAAARALLARGASVRALVRNPYSAAAQALAALGAEVVTGDLDDAASLAQATAGARGVFSVQVYNPREPVAEVRQAEALIQAARDAGVEIFIQTSVSGAGAHRTMTGWAEGRWDRPYWDNKRNIEEAALAAGFPVPVVLKPAFMMDNLIAPKAGWMFPDLAEGRIITAISPETRLALIAADDIGRVAAEAIVRPDDFARAELELAGERLTLPEAAAVLSRAWGVQIAAETRPPAEVQARGQNPGWVQTQAWMNLVGYPARPEAIRSLGIEPISLADWACQHCDRRPGRTA